MVADSATDWDDCTTNPGADIDAVCLYGSLDALKACADQVEFTAANPPSCDENHKEDPSTVMGLPDGVATGDVFAGYLSLNGGSIVVGFEGGAEILCRDTIRVYEMPHPVFPESEDPYTVYVGKSACLGGGPNCEWTEVAHAGFGQISADIEWTW